MRARVVRAVAFLYIEHHIRDLVNRPGVLQLHAIYKQPTVEDSLKAHARDRVEQHYPSSEYNDDTGAVLPGVRKMVEDFTF